MDPQLVAKKYAYAQARFKRRLILKHKRRHLNFRINKFRIGQPSSASTTTTTISTPTTNTPLANITSQIVNTDITGTQLSQNSLNSNELSKSQTLLTPNRFKYDFKINLVAKFNTVTTSNTFESQPGHVNGNPSIETINNFKRNSPDKSSACLSESSEDDAYDSDLDSDTDESDLGDSISETFIGGEPQVYHDIGDPLFECETCGASMWYQERRQKARDTTVPKFQLCCGNGKVQLPFLKQPPFCLQQLLFDTNSKQSKHFQQNIRMYNSMFAFTSPGMKFDKYMGRGKGPPVLRLQGQPCHRMGSLLPKEGEFPKFAQLYIYDTDNEIANRIQSYGDNKQIDATVVANLSGMLDEHNVHAKVFRNARDKIKEDNIKDLKLRLIADRKSDGRIYNLPTVSEVAALIVGDVDAGDTRDIIIQEHSGKLERISEFHSSYLSYQYPLLFPFGEDGFRRGTLHKERLNVVITKRNRLTIMDWLSFRIQMRSFEAQTLLCSRRLFQQFLVDGYTMMESERLSFVRNNQSTLRVAKYQKLSSTAGEDSQSGKRVVLPSTFVGSKRYMDQLYFDGMAISAAVGFPDLFITFTCNPTWPEITRLLAKQNLKAHDRPDIITRVFKIKFNELLKDLTKNHVLGKVVGYLYTIEFQKRGLPHAHILLFLHPSSKYPTPDDINKIISAEIPNPESHKDLYMLVKTHMIHGPCGKDRRSSPCMQQTGKCSKYYPKNLQDKTIVDQDGYPVYRRRATGNTITKNGILMDNRNVVPYNSFLLLKYQAHINMEWCNQCTSIKYLFKYIHKGYDRITAAICRPNRTLKNEIIDEVKEYIDCRYISPAEACWRIFSFSIHGRKPAVERLFYHLEGQHSIYFQDYERVDDVLLKPSVTESMFTAWFEANKKYSQAKTLTYGQFVSKFVYVKKQRLWKPRKRGFTIGRLIWVPPTTGELYYFRMMLTVVKGPTCYDDIKKIGDTQYFTYRDACFAMGFLGDDREYISAIKEAKDWGSGHFLRKLFVVMLLADTMHRPRHVWNEAKIWLCDGILYRQRLIANNRDLQLTDEQIENLALIEIERFLEQNRKSLKDFPCLPYPNGYVTDKLGNRLIYDEMNYDVKQQKGEFDDLFSSLTDEQRAIYDTIMKAVRKQKGGVFFLHGYGGTGKTFMWKTLASSLRAKSHIVLTVASSGIASQLLPGGRTAHSKFKIPVPTLDNSTCQVEHNDDIAGLLKQTQLIIWDEAPMAHRFCFEALERTLRDVMSSYQNKCHKIFGGKVIVFGGDFRQILPVIPRGSRSDIVHATINSSKIWNHCQVLTLTQNMRLKRDGNSDEISKFAEWILKVGEGKLSEPNDGYAEIEIPKELLIVDYDDPVAAIVQSTYPNLIDQHKSPTFLSSRAILASTIEVVEQINNYVLSLIPGESTDYYSCDSIDRSDMNDCEIFDTLTPEFLNSLRTSGLPNHKITLKVGTPIMLMRNVNQYDALCNGTRLIVTKLAFHVIEAKVICGKNIGMLMYIPRFTMSPSQSPWPFKLNRRQFPIIVSYAMTINKSQGQSMENVGLYLPKDVFSHGQLYVAISRVTTKEGLKILIYDKEKKQDNIYPTTTTNVVYKEVFGNL